MKMPTEVQAAEQIKEITLQTSTLRAGSYMQLSVGPVLTQPIGSMRMPEGKTVFWLKQMQEG